jgi:hypothetical protein
VKHETIFTGLIYGDCEQDTAERIAAGTAEQLKLTFPGIEVTRVFVGPWGGNDDEGADFYDAVFSVRADDRDVNALTDLIETWDVGPDYSDRLALADGWSPCGSPDGLKTVPSTPPYRSSARYVVLNAVILVPIEAEECGHTEGPEDTAIRLFKETLLERNAPITVDRLQIDTIYVHHSGNRLEQFNDQVARANGLEG